jgi:hypothetical protein
MRTGVGGHHSPWDSCKELLLKSVAVGGACVVGLAGALLNGPAFAGDDFRTPHGGPAAGEEAVSRSDEPVLITGAAFPELDGRDLDEFGLFRWDPQELDFVPIPFQIDERYDRVFNPEVPELRFVEKIYDVFGEEDGRLDPDDELAFMYRDVGLRAPAEAPWPDWADPVRYEVAVDDPRPGSGSPTRFVYLFTGPAPPLSDRSYVQWNLGVDQSIETELYALDYQGNWLLTGYRVFPPCGSGLDLIDRLKGRARPLPERFEDEEGWSSNSFYLGGIVGPVRAIRYVRGATSGVNTIHHDVVYDAFWYRRINLRVHPIVDAWFYFDWRPAAEARIFTPDVRDGVSVDGSPDPDMPESEVAWHVISGTGGGLAMAYEVPDSPLYDRREAYYRDDASYDDAIPENPAYGDDDDALYGAFGNRVVGIGDSNTEAIVLEFRVYPLCDGEGSAVVGDTIDSFEDFPLQADPKPQWVELGPIRGLSAVREGDDVVLSWDPLAGADGGYRVYASEDPALAQASWTLLGEPAESSFRDVGAAASPEVRFYSAVGVDDEGGEGPW